MRASLLALGLFLGACGGRQASPAKTPDLAPACCVECRAAASKDPQARDLDLLECGSYAGAMVNGQRAMSETCVAWFAEHPTMVGACRDGR